LDDAAQFGQAPAGTRRDHEDVRDGVLVRLKGVLQDRVAAGEVDGRDEVRLGHDDLVLDLDLFQLLNKLLVDELHP